MPLNHDKLVARVAELRKQRDQALSQANFIAGALTEAEELLKTWDSFPEPEPSAPVANGHDAPADAH